MKKDLKLDKEEKEILKALENNVSAIKPVSSAERKKLTQIAQNTFAKNKSINIRISERDLLHLKARAAQEGLPYQTLISSVLHKYIEV